MCIYIYFRLALNSLSSYFDLLIAEITVCATMPNQKLLLLQSPMSCQCPNLLNSLSLCNLLNSFISLNHYFILFKNHQFPQNFIY